MYFGGAQKTDNWSFREFQDIYSMVPWQISHPYFQWKQIDDDICRMPHPILHYKVEVHSKRFFNRWYFCVSLRFVLLLEYSISVIKMSVSLFSLNEFILSTTYALFSTSFLIFNDCSTLFPMNVCYHNVAYAS